jgi:hypothetical protein
MLSDKIIKKQFIAQTVRRNADEVRRIQLERLGAAGERLREKFDIDAVIASVQGNPMTVSESGEEFIFSQKIIRQLRFLDMKKLGNMKIYNRLVWGILYGETAKDLMYGFTEEVKTALRRQLEAAGFK